MRVGKRATAAQYAMRTRASKRVQRGSNLPLGNTYAQSMMPALPKELSVGINQYQLAGSVCKVRYANPNGDSIKANESKSAMLSSDLRQKSSNPKLPYLH